MSGAQAASPAGLPQLEQLCLYSQQWEEAEGVGLGVGVWQLLLKTTTRKRCLSLLLMGSCKAGWEVWPVSGWPEAPP